ncbi:YeeE/YedE family protein [Massilia sp. PAMC28688]|uniref:YeeE/YedE family protein n=1 Tax=Massilia sp. PAMC28688 TaxID=2861283 RepID=UPI001C636CD2|nr:YeeE/YedE family protein [Massilia sp. PAMC28688]QYF93266.1 YeeE/YedE family protein [Massilia sp. PAMC28688]
MKLFLAALLAGLLFGLGLLVSGMSNPAKVLGFLDVAGLWDPSLAFVMGGAIIVGLVAFSFAAKMPASLLGQAWRLPSATRIDRRLVIGAVTFGVGWGLAGLCPGPALASLLLGGTKVLLFVAAMLAGMAIFALLEQAAPTHRDAPDSP